MQWYSCLAGIPLNENSPRVNMYMYEHTMYNTCLHAHCAWKTNYSTRIRFTNSFAALEWIMSHIKRSHVTHMNESCQTYEWVMSQAYQSTRTPSTNSFAATRGSSRQHSTTIWRNSPCSRPSMRCRTSKTQLFATKMLLQTCVPKSRYAVCCRVLQSVAVCCSVLQCVAVRCSVCCSVCCGVLQYTVCCRVLQSVAACCNVLQCFFSERPIDTENTHKLHKEVLQHAAAHCNTLQHTTAQSVSCSNETHDPFTCATWLIHMCDVIHSHMCHDASTCATWRIYMLDMTYSYVRQAASEEQRVERLRPKNMVTYGLTYEKVMSHRWIRYVPHMNESCTCTQPLHLQAATAQQHDEEIEPKIRRVMAHIWFHI